MAEEWVKVEGLRELNRALRRVGTKDAPKAVGRAHKRVGTKFIERMLRPRPDPTATGEGRGATVRPSASKREVLLRVGGKHRTQNAPLSPWGVRAGNRGPDGQFQDAPPRPDIRASVARNYDQLEDLYWDELWTELRDTFEVDR